MKVFSFDRRSRLVLLLCVLATTAFSQTRDASGGKCREPAVAGSFYPATRADLESTLRNLFEKAVRPGKSGKPQCLIVPHAGYVFSGEVAASGFLTIPADAEYRNIFIIASSHTMQFNGASVYTGGDYLTPLGPVAVNRAIAEELVSVHRFLSCRPENHEKEHSIEVQLPFIQYHFKNPPPIVPIVIGTSSVTVAKDLATALLPYFIPENLFIVSSDFSHYPAYDQAVRVDRLTADAIVQNNPGIFYNSLRKNSGEGIPNLATPCCSWSAVLTLLYLGSQAGDLEMTPVLYRNSGDVPAGGKDRVVGYWAITGHRSAGKKAFTLGETERFQLLELSRSTLESYILTGRLPSPPGRIPPALQVKAGAFVSLFTGETLRGCIGNFNPDMPLYQVVQEMTVAAATRDPRFIPVEARELPSIRVEISVLTPLQRINGIGEFIPGKHGIYMTRDGRSGTYLPQVAEKTGWSAEEMLAHCASEKAMIGLDGWKEADLYVYEAIVFGEE